MTSLWQKDYDDDSSDDSFIAAAATTQPANSILPDGLNSLRAKQSFLVQSSFLSSDDSDSDDELFGVPSTSTATRKHIRPKTVVGARTSFILGGKLGEGAYGTVREGIDEQSLRIVAVKVMDLRRLRKLRGGVEGIEREVAVQKRLKRHENLIELVDVVRAEAKNRMYIVLEMANGCTVQELLERGGSEGLPESQVANVTFQVLKGLQYMHGKGVVHRDIKPSNLMLTARGGVKISDFGVAEFLNEYEGEDEVSRTSGSPAFQAPEIARGELGYSGMKVDVWALGVTVYLLMTGRIPFEADNLLVLFEVIGRGVYEETDAMSEGARRVIKNMLTVDWRERWSVEDLLKDPWIVRGGVEVSEQQRREKGWVDVPRKEFGILEVVKKMYRTEGEGERQAEQYREEEVRWQPKKNEGCAVM